jgi:hypothetical protein
MQLAGRRQHAPSVTSQKNDARPGGQALGALPLRDLLFENPTLQ